MDNCMNGYNSCIFAYGQTGSGKTYTMLGNGFEPYHEAGDPITQARSSLGTSTTVHCWKPPAKDHPELYHFLEGLPCSECNAYMRQGLGRLIQESESMLQHFRAGSISAGTCSAAIELECGLKLSRAGFHWPTNGLLPDWLTTSVAGCMNRRDIVRMPPKGLSSVRSAPCSCRVCAPAVARVEAQGFRGALHPH